MIYKGKYFIKLQNVLQIQIIIISLLFFFISSSPRMIKHAVFLIYYNPPDFSEKCCILSQEKMSHWAPLTTCSKFTCLQEVLSPIPPKNHRHLGFR